MAATAGTLLAYALSRTTGLPQASQDIGNWSDSLGLTSVFVEGCTLLLGIYKLCTIRPAPILGAREHPDQAAVALPGAAFHPAEALEEPSK